MKQSEVLSRFVALTPYQQAAVLASLTHLFTVDVRSIYGEEAVSVHSE
jgi:hypothetical protein